MAQEQTPETERRQDGDDALVMRARYDANAFILLYDIYYDKIFRLCFTNLGVKQITEDITSVAFLIAAEEVRQFKGKTRRQFVEWLCNVAAVQIKSYLKKTNLENRDDEQIEIDTKHKERLRTKVLVAYEQGQAKKSKIFFYIGGVVLIIVCGLILLNVLTKNTIVAPIAKPKLQTQAEPQKPGKIIQRIPAPQPKPEPVEPEEPNEHEIQTAADEPNLISPIVKTKSEDGIRVEGFVVDWEQRPLPATITKGPFPQTAADRTICDSMGHFVFDGIQEGVEVFTAQCEGTAPAVKAVEIKEEMEPITFSLLQPSVISGQVIDMNGEPIADANISVASWQGINSLVFSTETDADGFFQWDSAPADEVLFDIQKNTAMSLRNYLMQSGVDYKVVMMRPFRIHGNIISAEPTVPVETFIMTIGYYFDKDKVTWQDANSVIFTGDKYEINITEPIEFKMKVQAEGFQTAESPMFNPSSNSFDYNFIMRKEN
ncbi:MAG: carboxypeptidase regulatory-like domain-containing protein [Planctomycetaceae bacterium]|nr:carboxypeptidase regulatory-like domain-containing protein [Planctomycetaceae bacterium]